MSDACFKTDPDFGAYVLGLIYLMFFQICDEKNSRKAQFANGTTTTTAGSKITSSHRWPVQLILCDKKVEPLGFEI